MWNLLTRAGDGLTVVVRPTTVQAFPGAAHEEVLGICWGWHRGGKWQAGEQPTESTFDHFIEKVLLPELAAGAVLRAGEQSDGLRRAP